MRRVRLARRSLQFAAALGVEVGHSSRRPSATSRPAFGRAFFAEGAGDHGGDAAVEPRIELRVFRADHAAAAAERRIFDDLPGALLRGLGETLADGRGILGMQMNSDITGGGGQLRQGLANDPDHLGRIDTQLPPGELLAHGQSQLQQFLFDFGIQLLQRCAEQLQDGVELGDPGGEGIQCHLAFGLRLFQPAW